MPPENELIDLYRKQGWNDLASIKADIAAGGWRGKVQTGAPQLQGYLSGSPVSSGGSFDPIAEARRINQFNIEANQPAIQQLETGKQPLKDRYAALVAEIKRKKGEEISKTEIGQAQEFGRRGIPLSSSAYDVSLGQARKPVEEYYQGQESLATTSEAQDVAAIDQAIAQLRSGDPQSAIQGAMSLLQLRKQEEQFASTQAQRDKEFAESQRQFGITEARLSKTGSGGGGTAFERQSSARDELLQLARQGTTLSDLQARFGGKLTTEDIVKSYTSVSPYGEPQEAYARKILGLEPAPEEVATPWWKKVIDSL